MELEAAQQSRCRTELGRDEGKSQPRLRIRTTFPVRANVPQNFAQRVSCCGGRSDQAMKGSGHEINATPAIAQE